MDANNDKIFYNRYNIGDCYNSDFIDINLEKIYYVYDLHEINNIIKIQKLIECYFTETTLYKKLCKKNKIQKRYIKPLFLEILNKIDVSKYNTIDIIISFCEYFQISYKNLYDELPIEYKKYIVKYFDKMYNIVDDILNDELIF